MARRGKFIELLDFPKFAHPSVLSLRADATALQLSERLSGGGFMSYGAIWPRVGMVVRGLATEIYIINTFRSYGDSWKNETLRDVVRLLRSVFGGKGTWYPEPSTPKYVLGFWFRPSIKGIWFHEGRPYAVLINARKGQPLTMEDVRFLARGIHELHCIDDPNDPIPMIIDLSEHDDGKGRELKVYVVEAHEAASLIQFEESLREFLVALNMAGISLPLPPALENIVSLFKKKR
jgi:hypothetical protein